MNVKRFVGDVECQLDLQLDVVQIMKCSHWSARVHYYVDRNTVHIVVLIYRVAQKSKPLPNDQKTVLNRIKVCQWD